jgi:serine/threonine-protein kinase
MQYDIDQFLSQYEFTPSNIHLSNFLKQLFHDEMEEERGRLAKMAHSGANDVEPELISNSGVELISESPAPVKARRPSAADVPRRNSVPDATRVEGVSNDRAVHTAVSGASYQALEKIAKRHGLTVSTLVRDVLEGWLKYR